MWGSSRSGCLAEAERRWWSACTYDDPKDYYRALGIFYPSTLLFAAQLWPASTSTNLKLHSLVTRGYIPVCTPCDQNWDRALVSGPRYETRRYTCPFPISVCLGYRPRYVCRTWFERRRTRTGVYYWRLKNHSLGDSVRNGDDKEWLTSNSPLRNTLLPTCQCFLVGGKKPRSEVGGGDGGGTVVVNALARIGTGCSGHGHSGPRCDQYLTIQSRSCLAGD